MKRRNKILLIFYILINSLSFTSCKLEPIPNHYSHVFTRAGYYIRYDGLHYMYMCTSEEIVRNIIKYYYPDCFDVKVYLPGTTETGYLNTIYYATWYSYMDYVEIK